MSILDEETQEDIAFKMEEELVEYYSYLKNQKLQRQVTTIFNENGGIRVGKLSIEELNDF